MERFAPEVAGLYAELLEQLEAAAAARSIGDLAGTFTTKTVEGNVYTYFQVSTPGGGTKQLYLGRRTRALDALASRRETRRGQLAADLRARQQLCSLLRVGGASVPEHGAARLLTALADAGVFALGGVVVGTHAFATLGNMLGLRWGTGSHVRTADVDVAAERQRDADVDVATPALDADVPATLASLEMGFLPVPPFDLKESSTSFKVRGHPLRLDLLTPGRRGSEAPVYIKRLHAAASPLEYLDYVIEQSERAALVTGAGVLVNVPAPARFAFHKLIVAQERPVAFRTKATKDLAQAAAIFGALVDDRPGDLDMAWAALARRGTAWARRASAGLTALGKTDRTLELAVRRIVR